MKLNFNSDLSVCSIPACEEAQKTLEYTLLLPKITAVNSSQEDWVSNALVQCHCACHSRLFYLNNGNFFGDFNCHCNDSAKLYDLHQNIITEYNEESPLSFLKKDFFANTILSQCILSAYDAIMHILIQEKYLKSYSLANIVKKQGFNELTTSGILKSDFSCKRKTLADTIGASSYASAFESKLNTHLDIWKSTKFIDILPYAANKIPLLDSALIYRLANIDSRLFKNYLELYNQGNSKSLKDNSAIWNTYVDFHTAISEDLPKNETDRLYYLYRLENLFSLNLANCVLQNVYQLKYAGKPYPDGINDYKTISMLCKLPNVFSRNLYLQFAFDAIWNDVSPQGSFFDQLFKPEQVVYTKQIKPFNIHEWLLYFEKFCRFFSELVYPVYEWYFLLTLLKTVEENTKAGFIDKMIILQKELSHFIEKHHEYIENPLTGEKNSGLSLLSNYDNDKIIKPVYYKTNDKDLKKIFSTPSQDIHSLPNIAMLLTTMNPVNAFKELPLPNFNKNFCITSNIGDVNYNRFIGQFISFVANK